MGPHPRGVAEQPVEAGGGGARSTSGGGSARSTSPLLSAPAAVYLFVGLFVPMLILLAYSFWPTRDAKVAVGSWTLGNYAAFFADRTYWKTLLNTAGFVTLASAIVVVLALPFAYFVAVRVRPARRPLWVVATILPFGTSYLIRIFAWIGLFGDRGALNNGLTALHLVGRPLAVLDYGKPAVVITFVYLLLPIAFLTIYVAVERMDPLLLEAAADLGARPVQGLLRVTLPLARTGLLTAFAFSFLTMVGDYVTPTLVGGTQGTLYMNLVVTKFGFSEQWGFGAALAFVLLVAVLGGLALLRYAVGPAPSSAFSAGYHIPRRSPLLRAYALAVLLLVYLPIGLVVLFAFNSSEFVGLPVTGLTLHWFVATFQDPVLLDALHTSLVVAAWALGLSLPMGTLAAAQLARGKGRWRTFLATAMAVPLGIPPVMLGLALIIAVRFAHLERGLWTVIGAHALLILPVVTFIVLVRLEGVDRNLELAATDLGANRVQTFLRIVVPQAMPAVVAATLIGFALSMDEFIVTFLVTGHDATLPLFIYSSLHYQSTPELNALSALMLGGSFLLCGLAAALLRRSRRGRGREGGRDGTGA